MRKRGKDSDRLRRSKYKVHRTRTDTLKKGVFFDEPVTSRKAGHRASIEGNAVVRTTVETVAATREGRARLAIETSDSISTTDLASLLIAVGSLHELVGEPSPEIASVQIGVERADSPPPKVGR